MGKTIIQNKIEIIETGTYDVWTYRKWSDGTAECWGSWGFYAQAGQTSNGRYFPSNLFLENSTVVGSIMVHVGGNIDSGVRYNDMNSSDCNFWITSPGANDAIARVYAIGRWR